MPVKLLKLIILFLAFASYNTSSAQPTGGGRHTITVLVIDSLERNPIPFASVYAERNGLRTSGITDADGKCRLVLSPAGVYLLNVSFIGYRTFARQVNFTADGIYTVQLVNSPTRIKEVIVTATESRGMTSSTYIGRDAMEHLQPSSFSDLLELLPGGKASDPSLGYPNLIRLREGLEPISSAQYATSSLGTAFLIDGVPISTNANIQYVAGSYAGDPAYYRDIVNMGVDMRTISTDGISEVEIVRGIPSVAYGDLTSGLINITRKRGGDLFEARFKADMKSKLYAVSKAFENNEQGTTLNVEADLLDYKSDPRNKLENYKRATISVRGSKTFTTDKYFSRIGTSLDYTGSFDNEKEDPELNNGNLDKYRSSYNRAAWSGNFSMKKQAELRGFFRGVNVNAAVSAQFDKIDRTRYVSLWRPTAAPSSLTEGVNDAVILPSAYTASMTVDGKPFNAYAKAVSNFSAGGTRISNDMIAGAEWSMDKNYGKGQIFDMLAPVFPSTAERPRAYDIIPARQQLSFFAEDLSRFRVGQQTIVSVMAGVRASTLLNLGREYEMRGKFYFDPRVDAKVSLPSISLGGRRLDVEIGGGVGWHTKFPTMDQLYPAPLYMDITQLFYYATNPDYRRINMMTYIIDPTNPALEPARNLKWELRIDATLGGNRLSVTYFRENMGSGFRSTSDYKLYSYRSYDASSVSEAGLTGPPALEDFTYEDMTVLYANTMTTNGSRTKKEGIEFTFSSKRIESIRTRVTVSGAWMKTKYSNSQPGYYKPSISIGGITYPYIGVYEQVEGYMRESFNTNFMFDTDMPSLGLRFSASFQCIWYTSRQSLPLSSVPIAYIDTDGRQIPYTEDMKTDAYLQHLVRDYSASRFERSTIPFGMDVNLKATKMLYSNKIMVAVFVNKIFDWYPDYKRGNYTFHRYVNPYFGMELNFRL